MSDKPAISFIFQKYPSGGAQKVSRDIADGLRDEYRFYMFVCDLDEERLGEIDYQTFTFVKLPDPDLFSVINLEFLSDFIIRNYIHIFINPGFYIDWLQSLKERTNVKIIFSLHSAPFFDNIHRKSRALYKVDNSFIKRIAWHLYKRKKIEKGIYSDKLIELYRRMYHGCDVYTVLWEADAEIIKKKLGLVDGDKIRVTHSFLQPRKLEIHQKKKIILYVGRLELFPKRPDRVLSIWTKIHKNYPEWKLIFVGGGPEEENLKELTRRLHLRNVFFTGMVSDPTPYYKDASILLLTSDYEGGPLVTAEAQQHGVIPISFDCGEGVRNQFQDNKFGITVSSFSIKKYAAKLAELIDDAGRMEKMSEMVRIKAADYSKDKSLEEWLEIFSSLIS